MKRGAEKKPIRVRNPKRARSETGQAVEKTSASAIFLQYFQFLLNWCTEDKSFFPFLLLPQELQLYIMQYLSIEELNACALVCKDILPLTNDNSLWRKFALEHDIQVDGASAKNSETRHYKNLLKSCLEVRQHFPEEIIDLFDNEQALAQLPVICPNYRQGSGFTNFAVEDLKGHETMRGVSHNGEPFVAFCVKATENAPGESLQETRSSELEAYSFRLSSMSRVLRYKEFLLTYQNGNKFKSFRCTDPSFEQMRSYLKRLIRHEPCQQLREPFELTLQGKSRRRMVELTDQSEFESKQLSIAFHH